ncbi:MAG: hypothetical protein U0990_00835 [Candidatus Nanopelagicales bacterium]|nr:hypothetical protein [Candidatus Nanopelagicales bacterium]MDZ4248621.1 hypothetical protein [Candidatus Nanopelagicales bacterium]
MKLLNSVRARLISSLNSPPKALRRSTRRRLVAATVCIAVVAGSASVGASAAPVAPTSALNEILFSQSLAGEQSPLAASDDKLKVTVGKTVAVTTDQSGGVTPFNIMLVNGQVSGQGTGEVKIPMGPDSEKTVDINSASGQVSNFFDFGGFYKGDLPVSVKTEVKVNGESINPDEAYGLTGDAEITYTFTNHTARKQEISYKDITGKTTKKEVEVPVPFGATFDVPFGSGWYVQDAPGLTSAVEPNQTHLSGTVVLFPVVQGLYGGTTQKLTVKARADNASLPSTKTTSIVLDMDTYMGGLLTTVVPMIEKDALAPADAAIGGVIGQVLSAVRLVSGYVGALQKLDKEYLKPVFKKIERINVNPENLDRDLGSLGVGLTKLGELMGANKTAQGRVANLAKSVSNVVRKDAPAILKWLKALIKTAAPQSGQAAKGLKKLDKAITSLDLTQLENDSATLDQACPTVGKTSDYYGYGPVEVIIPITKGSDGYNALAAAIKAGKKKPWQGDLEDLQTTLDNQSVGAMMPSLLVLVGGLLPDTIPYKKLIQQILTESACESINETLIPLVIVGAGLWDEEVHPWIDTAVLVLDLLAEYGDSPVMDKIFNEIMKDVKILANLLSNDKCTSSDIIDPILAALQKYGMSGIKDHILPVLLSVFKNCGVAQVLEFFGSVDGLIGEALIGFGKIVDGARGDVPTIVNAINSVKAVVKQVDDIADTIPGAANEILDVIADTASGYGVEGQDAIAKVSNFVEETGATLQAMNARAKAGDGDPYGKAVGPDTNTMTAYQITQQEASPYARNWATGVVLALVFLAVAVGVGTYLYRRRRSS